MPRPAALALSLLALLLLAFAAILAGSSSPAVGDQARLQANRQLAAHLGLTDLALITEARYTRHPSQADLHSAFQDAPGAMEHFPTGSLIHPPAFDAPETTGVAGHPARQD